MGAKEAGEGGRVGEADRVGGGSYAGSAFEIGTGTSKAEGGDVNMRRPQMNGGEGAMEVIGRETGRTGGFAQGNWRAGLTVDELAGPFDAAEEFFAGGFPPGRQSRNSRGQFHVEVEQPCSET